ncbi:TetR/AcrR family transcriptional regulator [Planococcus halocryophilus]|uniref:TetR/AcrR family transcriptional regulator n=1 Tax=Planococcus halocryophilus TaxID=1215089 RepID=UPI001F0EE693|nr:TetR/AcrR family transcriptional regulator [Planococcus halocryophilus]MCH4827550.1 TetR/AcrR family transcriptional regulator [Planococcus halocryophilus]
MSSNVSTNRESKAKITKKKLFKSALKLFKEKGIENVHIEEITDLAGVSKGSFYTHFKSKHDVVLEHYQLIDEVYEEKYKELEEANLSLTEKLQTILLSGFYFCDDMDFDFLSAVLINQLSSPNDETFINNPNRKLYKIVKSIIEEGMGSLEFKNEENEEFYVGVVLVFYKGLFLEYSLLKDPTILLSKFGEKSMNKIIEEVLIKKD